ncbi:hypothetical protein SBA4_100011 [Candidatus Sulfopaludibacter sp. SbA4]|nr:hypothetical protein SBA4_100011 [Candidatus Sulfopaludibacter sp. SbA4]
MKVNKYLPHVLVLPEDDANRELANGFLLDPYLSIWKIQVLEEVGGWRNVLDHFLSHHVVEMGIFPGRFMVLLIDFDGRKERLQYGKERIPNHLTDQRAPSICQGENPQSPDRSSLHPRRLERTGSPQAHPRLLRNHRSETGA